MKVARSVWSGGKAGDCIKDLPITIIRVDDEMQKAINKYYYSPRKMSLQNAFEMYLLEHWKGSDGKLRSDAPKFAQFQKNYRRVRSGYKNVISRQGIGDYQKNFRPLLGSTADYAQNCGLFEIRSNRAKLKETSDTTTEAASVANLIQSGFYLLDGLANGEDFFYANILVTVTADTLYELNRRYDELEKMAKSLDLKIRRPMFQMENAFTSTLPLCNISNAFKRKSRRNMLTSGASSLYPFINRELQDPGGIMLGVAEENNSLVAVDVFDTARHANANGTIMGKTGYGKTFTAQLLALRMRLQGIQTFIITPLKGKEDYKRACDQIDGQYLVLGPGSPYSINVLDIHVPDTEGLRELDGYDEEMCLLAKKVQDLHTFFHLVVRDLTQEEEQMLDGIIYDVYRKFGITEDNESVFIPGTKEYREFPLLGDIHDAIKDEPVLRRVYNILTPMVNC